MRLYSREVLVGFLLALVMAASGCQANVPVAVTPETQAEATSVESTPATDTATLTVTEEVSTSAAITSDEAVAEVVTTTAAVTATETVTTTESVTATDEVTTETEIIIVEGSAPSAPASPADPALIAAGLTVYRAQYYGVCHTLDAAETRGTFGPTHNGLGTTAAQRIQDGTYHGPATTAAEYIHESIVDPQAYITPGYATTSHRMPSYAHLDTQSLDALVAFLLAQQ